MLHYVTSRGKPRGCNGTSMSTKLFQFFEKHWYHWLNNCSVLLLVICVSMVSCACHFHLACWYQRQGDNCQTDMPDARGRALFSRSVIVNCFSLSLSTRGPMPPDLWHTFESFLLSGLSSPNAFNWWTAQPAKQKKSDFHLCLKCCVLNTGTWPAATAHPMNYLNEVLCPYTFRSCILQICRSCSTGGRSTPC